MNHYLINLFLLMCCSVAFANGNPVMGKDKAIICTACHGEGGNNENSEYPRLAGQVEAYLLKQLKDFKSGARVDDHMTSMVLAVDESDFEDIIAYFASNKLSTQSAKSKKPEVTLGKRIFSVGLKDKSVPACSSCHGDDALGNKEAVYPSLASQHEEYLVKTLKDFREGKRKNDKWQAMKDITSKLNDKEIKALANYLSHL